MKPYVAVERDFIFRNEKSLGEAQFSSQALVRVIVYCVVDIKSSGHELYPDVYVSTKLRNNVQLTDTHYGVIDDNAYFNYRLVFPLTTQEEILSPLEIRAMDFDFITGDDQLGTLYLDLSAVPFPPRDPKHCTLTTLDRGPKVNMFDVEDGISQISGFWPLAKNKKLRPFTKTMSAKIHLTLQVLTEEKAELFPASSGNEKGPLNQFPSLSVP
ncbi:myoferlin-like [Penaeus chinensis]|uniref:myoferlin-like n=1 Tax=Penaeus chinensis TaxID=139456 RepID=UPI001FB60118|nr:myoferlin-like [Penaeus chinensis]